MTLKQLTAILKNNAYNELDKLAEIADKNYPKSMLASYQLGLMYEKMGDAKEQLINTNKHLN
jgi:hypothetical protein